MVTPLYLICFASLGLLAWLVQDVHAAMASGDAAIRTSTGWHYMLLPAVLPLIHLMAVMEHFGARRGKALIKRYGGGALAVALLVLYGVGWGLESRLVTTALNDAGYSACPASGGGLRSVNIEYVQPGTACGGR
ncbi:hypothetical protein [Alkalilimnicola sp. S0819]|uniref:hypothetical protein n=1 Tax=Alkalilimnicola sp. S0819 TaxID=2613922 RepID=UPI001261DEE4|nr:hypothetical protein [Alkalilimnicola sp. S0819]KAB7624104.1 hypothetical protein F3N43_06865 [Alkalilimnicola sp. S0819]MPQ16355.1 hypothetical protein [Alkalilimnicola sp. S0819]